MAISDADKQRARKHLGFMAVRVASSFAFGIQQLTDMQFMFEDAITRVLPEAEADVIKLLDRLDCIDDRMFEASGELFAERVDQLVVNLQQPDMLEREYARWAKRLADLLGVFVYPFAERFDQLAGGIRNIRVVR